MKIWLIRHGTTRPGEEQRYQGCLDDGLSEKGREALLRADLAYPCVFGARVSGTSDREQRGEGPDSLTGSGRETGGMPAYVYVSPARRARQTAEILFPQAEQIVIPGLREMNFGIFEGRSWREMQEDADYRSWVDSGCEGQCPGGEDRASFTKRICSAFDRILDRESGPGMRCAWIECIRGTDPLVHFRHKQRKGETKSGTPKAAASWASEEKTCLREEEPTIIIVAHGGTQMALLAERGSPAGDYFSRQTPCGCGWLLEPEESTGFLKVLREVRFLRP